MSISLVKISYQELRDRSYPQYEDRYEIASYLSESAREALLACPGNLDDSKTAMVLMLDGNVIIGRETRYGTRIMIGDEIKYAQSGGGLEIEESYRKEGLGADIMMENVMSKEYELKMGSFFSSMMIPMLKKLKFTIIEIPQYLKLNNARYILESIGLKGFLLRLGSSVANFGLRILNTKNKVKYNKLKKKFDIKKVNTIPSWVENMAVNDGHKYRELHDQKWFQWNLDYNLHGLPQDIQSFYAVYDKQGNPQGFFMTKERFEEEAGKWKNIIRGVIVEWGTANEEVLSEADLNLMAIYSFTPDVFHITTVSISEATGKQLKKMGFRPHGTHQMSYREKGGKQTEANNPDLWRLRYGCCNSILY